MTVEVVSEGSQRCLFSCNKERLRPAALLWCEKAMPLCCRASDRPARTLALVTSLFLFLLHSTATTLVLASIATTLLNVHYSDDPLVQPPQLVLATVQHSHGSFCVPPAAPRQVPVTLALTVEVRRCFARVLRRQGIFPTYRPARAGHTRRLVNPSSASTDSPKTRPRFTCVRSLTPTARLWILICRSSLDVSCPRELLHLFSPFCAVLAGLRLTLRPPSSRFSPWNGMDYVCNPDCRLQSCFVHGWWSGRWLNHLSRARQATAAPSPGAQSPSSLEVSSTREPHWRTRRPQP